MKGLLIKDKTHWCDTWSAHLATSLEILDSSFNLLIFHHRHGEAEILSRVPEAPRHIFEILDLEEASEACSDLVSDTGTHYRIVQ